MRTRTWLALVAAAACTAAVGCAAQDTGPWSMESLQQAPAFTWAGPTEAGGVRSLFYTGEPFEGRATRVFAWYAAPPTKLQVPGVVLVHGGGGTAFREWAELWAKRGYAAIAMDLAGCGPDAQRLPDGGPDQRDTTKFEAIERGTRQAWPYHAVANVIRAHSLLRSMPAVDPRRTAITGISWGGYLTCIVASLDTRFRAAVPVYGCGFLHQHSAWVDVLDKMPEAQRQLWIENYDPSRYLPRCTVPMLFVNGTNDLAYPLDSYQESYRLVRGPRTLCVTVNMPHSHPAGWAPQEIGIFIDSILHGGEALARIGPPNRHGREVSVSVSSPVPLASAALHYTTDDGVWQRRQWTSEPAVLSDGHALATLPRDGGVVYFLTVTDHRGAVVSSEHEVVPATASVPHDMAKH